MSGAKLCSLLGELGYEGSDGLDPDSFEWPFQHEEARHLLQWICSSLRRSNVLSPAEVSQYEHFLQEGKLLEGEDLDFAYNSISAFSNRRNNQEAVIGAEEGIKEIREATLTYKAEALKLQKQLEHLQLQYDLLTGQSSSLIQGRRSRISSSSSANSELALLEEKLSARNLEMNEVLEKIASSAKELEHYHSGEEEGIYLTYLDFGSYLLEDSSCKKELDQWFAKQLRITGTSVVEWDSRQVTCSTVLGCEVQVVRISWGYVLAPLMGSPRPTSAPENAGDKEKSCHHRVTELQRLRSIFGTSERQWVEAQVENAKQQAVLLALKSQIASDEAHIHLDLHSLRRKHSDLTGELSNLYMKEQKLLSELMRQEYYITQQKVFINHLVNQLARHQFLKLACDLERETILRAHELLRVVESELDGYIRATSGRVDRCLSLIQIASEAHEQGAVDDRDSFLHAVRDLLSLYTNAQGVLPAYVSVPGIIQHIKELQSDLMYLQSDLENTLPEDRNGCINDMCNLIQAMQQLLFASSTTSQPILTPWPLMKELAEMEKVNSQLSAAVEDVTREHREKAEIVKHHPHEVGRERQVFVDFFCNPDRLKSQVREMAARVKALQV
ncbi:AUGMIN subunit 3 [Nymphaea thermarum]|nr:AUGMIN subunit 3 [Nymphaea thermarum]